MPLTGPGTNSFPGNGVIIIDETPIVGGTDGYVLYDNNGVVGVEAGGGGGSLTVNVTAISGGTAGYALIDNGGTLEEAFIRTVLLADATYYVNASTGSDSNPGTALLPWATAQHACDFTATTLDGAGHNLTINIAAGTYTLVFLNEWIGFQTINLVGAGSSTVIFHDMQWGANAFVPNILLPNVNVDGVSLVDNGSTYSFQNYSSGGQLQLGQLSGDVKFVAGVSTLAFNLTQNLGAVTILGSVSYTGNAIFGHWAANSSSVVNEGAGTFVSTPAFSGAFYFSEDRGLCYQFTGATFSGAVAAGLGGLTLTGGVIDLQGFGATNLPGGGGIMCLGGGSQEGPTVNIQAPGTGGTVAIDISHCNLILHLAGTLATLTIDLPPIPAVIGGIPYSVDGPTVSITADHTVTALTLATLDTSTVTSGPTTLAPNVTYFIYYNVAGNTWYSGKAGE